MKRPEKIKKVLLLQKEKKVLNRKPLLKFVIFEIVDFSCCKVCKAFV